MNSVVAEITPWCDAVGRSLLHFFWQGLLIGLVYIALRPFCKSIAQRYRLGMATLLLMLAAPLTTLLLLRPASGLIEDPIVSAVAGGVPALGAVVDAATKTGWSDARWEQALPWLVAAWLIGVCIIATRSFLHWHRLSRIVRGALPLPRDWQMRLIQLRQRFGVMRPVRLLSSIHIATPTLIGWLKPAILLPASLLSGFTPAQIELIVAHELSHVRRFDYIANLAQVVIETLLFYHPVVFWISRDVRQARESCCDDLVLTLGGGDAVAYARTLADLEEMHHDFGAAVPALGVGGGVLLARIRRIVDPTYVSALEPLPRSNGITLPMVLACVGVALALLRMHLIPTTLVDALMPKTSIELSADRGAMFLSVPSIAAVSAVRMIVAPRSPLETPAPPTVGPRPAADLPVQLSIAAPLPQVVPLRADSELKVVLPVAAVRSPEHVDAVSPASVPAPAQAATRTASGPEPVQMVPARYPLDALRSGVTGKVDLDFRIAADGSVRDVRVLHAQPSGIFEQAATAALRQWRFDVTGKADLSRRYARSFAFARADASLETCREVTGSHICRKQSQELPEN